MSGRGRGRGRGGILISCPDGVECKPPRTTPYPQLKPPYGMHAAGVLPPPPPNSADDAQLLDMLRIMRRHEASQAAYIAPAPRHADIEKYSERYRAPPPRTSFRKSRYCVLVPGVHCPAELDLPSQRASERRGAKRKTPSGLQGISWAEGADELEVLEAVGAADAADGERAAIEAEADSDSGSDAIRAPRRRRLIRAVQDDEPDDAALHAGGEDAEDAVEEFDSDAESEEEMLEDENNADDFGGDFEDGFDDVDSGDDGEPTY